jgi:hypothetical protein
MAFRKLRLFAPVKLRCAVAVLGVACSASSGAVATAESLYFVGNSLTNGIRLPGFSATARANGYDLEVGYHIRGNTALVRHASFPDEDGVNAFPSRWNQALAGQVYDRVMLQPYITDESTLGSDLAAIRTILANVAGTPIAYIYAPWPRQSAFFDIWNRTGPVGDETRTFLGNAYFTTLVERARDDQTLAGTPFFLIPAGEAIATLNAKMVAGQVPGFGSYTDLFGDEYHVNNAGSFVAAMTVYATLVGDPRGIEFDTTRYTDPRLAEAAPIFQEVIWDVVTTNPYTGVIVPEPSYTGVGLWIVAVGCAYWGFSRRGRLATAAISSALQR